LRWMPASSASWRCARTMAVRAAIEPVVPEGAQTSERHVQCMGRRV
jgi:hypothetical protein